MKKWIAFSVLLIATMASAQNYPPYLLYDSSGNPYPNGSGTPLGYNPPPFTCYTNATGQTLPCNFSGGSTTLNPLTMNNSGTGAASGATFNGSAAVILSTNTIGALNLAGGTLTGLLTTPEINAGPPESSLPPYLQGYTGGNTALLTGIDPDGTQIVAVGLESYDATSLYGPALYVVRLQEAPADGGYTGAIEGDGIGGGTTTYAEVLGLEGYAELDDTASTGVLTDYKAFSPENFSSGTVDKETGFYAATIYPAPGVATIRAAFYSEDQGNDYAFYAEGGKIFSAGPLQVGGSVQMTGITGQGAAGFVGIDAAGNLSVNSASGRKGTFTCTAAGTITISNANEAATSDVIISLNTAGGTISTPPAMKTVTASTGFTVLCGAADTSVYNYDILN